MGILQWSSKNLVSHLLRLSKPGASEVRKPYSVQEDIDRAVRVKSGGLAAERGDFAKDANSLIGEGVEVLGVDAGGRFGRHCRVAESMVDATGWISNLPEAISHARVGGGVAESRDRQSVICQHLDVPEL